LIGVRRLRASCTLTDFFHRFRFSPQEKGDALPEKIPSLAVTRKVRKEFRQFGFSFLFFFEIAQSSDHVKPNSERLFPDIFS